VADDPAVLARGALDWLVEGARPVGDGLGWTEWQGSETIEHDLYGGGAGVVLALLEGHAVLGDDAYGVAAARGVRALIAALDEVGDCSLFFGLSGIGYALSAAAARLGDPEAARASRRAFDRVRAAFDGDGWSEAFELLFGNAGIAHAALAVGDTDLAVLAVEPYLRRAEPTAAGLTWQHRAGVDARLHHVSHGTLGIVSALAAVGRAAGRDDLVAAALAGAADVVSRDEAGPEGFLVPHSDPPYRPELIERYSYGWCHGPAGDAPVFSLLGDVTGDPAWQALADRCWHTVVHSGLPRRLRPGFWDNSARCCGTAGVLALALERRDPFAATLITDIAERATVDGDGLCWSNREHRVTPSDLPPRYGWAMGNAGIARELLRASRPGAGYAVGVPGL
jgi:hypothetical protein